MSFKKLAMTSLMLPLLASAAAQAADGGITDRAFSKWMKSSETLGMNLGGDFSLQGTCDGQKAEFSFKSYGNFLRMRLFGKEFVLDESNFELPASVDDLDEVRVMRHGKSDKLAIFIPPTEGTSAVLFYVTASKDGQSALLQAVDLSKTKDLERPIATACILSIVPAQAVSNETTKPTESQAPAAAPETAPAPAPAAATSEEVAPPAPPAPAPAPETSTGSAQ